MFPPNTALCLIIHESYSFSSQDVKTVWVVISYQESSETAKAPYLIRFMKQNLIERKCYSKPVRALFSFFGRTYRRGSNPFDQASRLPPYPSRFFRKTERETYASACGGLQLNGLFELLAGYFYNLSQYLPYVSSGDGSASVI